MIGISKRFDATQALDDVSLTLYPGEIARAARRERRRQVDADQDHDRHPPAGRRRRSASTASRSRSRSSAEAQRHGIAAIYQEPTIFPDLNVAENIFMSHQDRGPIVRWRRMYHDAEAILARLDVRLDVRRPGQRPDRGRAAGRRDRQGDVPRRPRADHGRADRGALGARGRAALQAGPRGSPRVGVAILFISHRLDEVFEIADRVTVLRDGRLISSTTEGPRSPRSGAIRDMVGREMSEFFARNRTASGRRGSARRGTRAVRASSRTWASSCARARCSASPAWSAPAAPTSRSRCSGSRRRRRQRRAATAGRCRSAHRGRRCAHGIAYLSEDRRAARPLAAPVGHREHHARHPRPIRDAARACSTAPPSTPSPTGSGAG